jgi:PAS domain S-box-containing protein
MEQSRKGAPRTPVSASVLAAAFDHAPAGMAITGEGAHLLRVNQALADMLGYAPQELIGKSVVDLTHPDDLSDSMANNERLLRGDETRFVLEKRYHHKAGHSVLARAFVSTLSTEPRRHLLHVVDIGHERETVARLHDAEVRFHEMTDAIDQDFWVVSFDPYEFRLYSSAAAVSAFGFDPMAHPESAQRILERIHPADLDLFTELFDPAVHAPREREYRVIRADGSVGWVRTRVFPLADVDGRISRLTGVSEDITRRKKAETEVADFRAFEEFVMRVSTEFVGIPSERIREPFERALRELSLMIAADRAFLFVLDEQTHALTVRYSWSREGVSSAPSFAEFPFAPDDPLRARLVRTGLFRVDDVATLPDSFAAIRQMLLATGVESFINLPLVRGDRLIGLFGFGTVGHKATWPTDIGARLVIAAEMFSRALERMWTEAEVRKHRDALGHALRLGTVGQLTSGIAHELNQPLAAILNYASAVERRGAAGNGDLAWIHETVRKMAEQAVRAADVIRTLRTLVRKGGGERTPHDPHKLIDTALRLLEPELVAADISIAVERDTDVSRVQVDPIQIEQVVMNLVGNAIDAVRSGPRTSAGEILVETRMRSPTVVEVRVSDTGPGIAPAHVTLLFDQFFTTKEHGLGLGLSISRSIVESHGGTLQLENTSANGTTFSFTLPSPQP